MVRAYQRLTFTHISDLCVVTWRQALYTSTREDASGVLLEAPSVPASPVATRQNGQVTVNKANVPVNNGVVRTGLRMMVSRVLGFA